MQTDLTERLTAFAANHVTPTRAVVEVARLSALDWVAVGRAGASEPVSMIMRQMAESEGGARMSSIFGSQDRFPPRTAALVNGTTAHALDYDDTHFAHIGHPSVAVLSAALAVGEARDATVADVLEAGLVGMECSIRIGLWLGRSHYQVGFHQTATAGAFGAAIASARLSGLGPDAMAQVLGLTSTRAAGLKAQFGTMGKPYNAGIAAQTGVEVAQMVSLGFEANPDAFDGPFGFGATHHGEASDGPALDGLGERWFFEGVSHKFHACCHGLHATLEALRSLDVAAQEAAEVVVRTHPRWMSVCNQPAPTTGLGAKFSYRTVVAMQLLGHDTAQLESYSDTLCADPRVQTLRNLVQVEPDESLSETAVNLTVLRKDGRTLQATYDLSAPMELETRRDRVQEKAAALIGRERTAMVWALLQGEAAASELGAMIAQSEG